MSKCEICGKIVNYTTNGMCDSCYQNKKQERILSQSKNIKKVEDFKSWDSGDFSELFWLHLGRYQKYPNRESYNIMYMALRWAAHSSHGLSNSFNNALKWCNIDLFNEQFKLDNIPEKYVEDR